MTSEGLFFIGFLFGFFFCLILIYIIRREMEQVAEGERVAITEKEKYDEYDENGVGYKYPKDCRQCKHCLPMTKGLFECAVGFPCFKKGRK